MGEQIPSVALGLVDDPIGDIWNYTEFDGIMGLGFPSLMNLSSEMPIIKMYSEGLIGDLSYSFYTPYEDQGYLVIGGVDYTLNSTPFTYHSVILPFYWLIQLDYIMVKDAKTGEVLAKTNLDTLAIVDTGTSFLAASPSLFNEIIASMPNTNCMEAGPSLAFVIQGKEYVIPDNSTTSLYVQVEGEKGEIICVPALSEMDFGEPLSNAIILGETFLSLFYAHFDMGNLRVGFANAK